MLTLVNGETFAPSQIWTLYQFMDPLGNSLFGEFAHPRMKKIIDTANVNNINVTLLQLVGGLYLLGTHLVNKLRSFFACITIV